MFCINLERREDRKNEFIERFSKFHDISHITFYKAIDGKDSNSVFDPIIKNSGLKSGEKGCFQSHLNIWKMMTETTIIFEDDCFFNETFSKIFEILPQIPKDADLVYIGGLFRPNFEFSPKLLFDEYFYKKLNKRPRTAHSYILTMNGRNKLLKFLEKSNDIFAVDSWITFHSFRMNIYELKKHMCYSPYNYKTDIQ